MKFAWSFLSLAAWVALCGCDKQPTDLAENVPLDAQVSEAQAEWQSNQVVLAHMPLEQLKARADKGDALSQLQLGLDYLNGTGLAADPAASAQWLRKAAEQGNIVAQIYLADDYFNGNGVKKDTTEAMAWSEKILSNPEATRWCGLLANRGLTAAELFLGNCYAFAHHLDQDPAQAVTWYREAAKKGNAEAQFRIGICYSQGWGVESNNADALEWFAQAADQGHPEAQSILGGAYASGDDVTNDPAEAYKWLSLAVTGETRPEIRERYQTMLAMLKARMRSDQVAEGERRVKEFVAR